MNNIYALLVHSLNLRFDKINSIVCGTYITALVKKRARNPWHLKRFVLRIIVKKIFWPEGC